MTKKKIGTNFFASFQGVSLKNKIKNENLCGYTDAEAFSPVVQAYPVVSEA